MEYDIIGITKTGPLGVSEMHISHWRGRVFGGGGGRNLSSMEGVYGVAPYRFTRENGFFFSPGTMGFFRSTTICNTVGRLFDTGVPSYPSAL